MIFESGSQETSKSLLFLLQHCAEKSLYEEMTSGTKDKVDREAQAQTPWASSFPCS